MSSDVRIRRYESLDEEAVRRIDFETGFFGDPMSNLLDDRRIFDRALDAYLASRPLHAFVAERDGGVEGYAIASHRGVGIATALAHFRGFVFDVIRWPRLSAKDRRYVLARLRAMFRAIAGPERRFRPPGGPRLHINLLAAARGEDIGSQLLEKLIEDLRASGASGVHANAYESRSHDTSSFWKRNGFTEVSRVRTSAWKDFGVEEDVDLVCYDRRFS